MDLRLQNYFTLIVTGPSKCGKTQWCHELMKIQHLIYSKPPGNIYFRYKVFQAKFYEMTEVTEFIKGLPSEEWLSNLPENSTVYCDDLAGDICKETANYFTIDSHHYRLNFVFVQHSIFSNNQFYREMSINCNYYTIFKNPRDVLSFTTLARQMALDDKPKVIIDMYKQAVKSPFGYLFVDYTQQMCDIIRLRTNIFNTFEHPLTLYCSNKSSQQ